MCERSQFDIRFSCALGSGYGSPFVTKTPPTPSVIRLTVLYGWQSWWDPGAAAPVTRSLVPEPPPPSLSLLAIMAAAVVMVVGGMVAWWDGGHMLTAEIARQSLSADEVNTLEGLLADWEPFFPNNSDLSAASIWPDLMRCTHYTSYCRTQHPPAVDAFTGWHFSDKPYNPDGLHLDPLEELAWSGNPSSSWLLTSAVGTFKQSRSRFSINLMLRLLLHIVGDMHQPLHAVQGFFNDSQYGHLVSGDWGGNAIRIANPDVAGSSNLHGVWDSACGQYQMTWPLSPSQKASLTTTASNLTASHPPAGFLTRIGTDALGACWARTHRDACEPVFRAWVDEMNDLAVRYVYPNVTNGASLDAAYLNGCRALTSRQITLGGYRLAAVLRLVLQSREHWSYAWPGVVAGANGAVADARAAARITELESERASLTTMLVLALFLAGGAFAALGRIAMKRRRRADQVRALAHKHMVEIGTSGAL